MAKLTKKQKEAIEELTGKALRLAAKDINATVEPSEPLPEKSNDKDELIAAINEAAGIIYDTDPLKKNTLATLKTLGITPLTADADEEEAGAEEEKEEEAPEPEKKEKKKSGKKTSGKKGGKAKKDDEEVPAPEKKKGGKKAGKDKKKAEPKAKKEKKASEPKYKRVTAFCSVVKTTSKKGLTIEQITEKTIALCEKNGLKASAKFESVGWILAHYMTPLVEMGVVSVNDKGIYKVV